MFFVYSIQHPIDAIPFCTESFNMHQLRSKLIKKLEMPDFFYNLFSFFFKKNIQSFHNETFTQNTFSPFKKNKKNIPKLFVVSKKTHYFCIAFENNDGYKKGCGSSAGQNTGLSRLGSRVRVPSAPQKVLKCNALELFLFPLFKTDSLPMAQCKKGST